MITELHKEAVAWRNQRRMDWVAGNIPVEDFVWIEKMNRSFPDD